MREILVGFVAGFLVALMCIGAVTTFSQVSGRGTYSAGYMVLPRCPSDITSMEFGSVCADESTGEFLSVTGAGLGSITTQAVSR